MPLFTAPPTLPTAPTPNSTPNNLPVDNASFYSNFNYNGNLIAFLDGTPWSCTFYTQYIGSSNQVGNSSDTTSTAIKQYQKIYNFELRVIERITGSVDQATGKASITGSANVYPIITPIIGDLFIAIVEGNEYGLFEVSSVERLTLYKESAWKINFILKQYLTSNSYPDGDSATISEFNFDVNALNIGSNPLTSTINVLNYTNTKNLIQGLVEYYYQMFYELSSNTFILKASPYSELSHVFDPQIIIFWNKIVDHNLLNGKDQPMLYDTKNGFTHMTYLTVLDAILQQSEFVFNSVYRYLKIMPKDAFSAEYQRYGLYLKPIDLVVYPYGLDSATADSNAPTVHTLTDYLSNEYLNSIGSNSIIYPPVPYIFSLDFYNKANTITGIEALTLSMIRRQAIPLLDVTNLVNGVLSANRAVQFYQIPILLALLKVAR